MSDGLIGAITGFAFGFFVLGSAFSTYTETKGRCEVLQALRPCVNGVEQTFVLNEGSKFVCAFGKWEEL